MNVFLPMRFIVVSLVLQRGQGLPFTRWLMSQPGSA